MPGINGSSKGSSGLLEASLLLKLGQLKNFQNPQMQIPDPYYANTSLRSKSPRKQIAREVILPSYMGLSVFVFPSYIQTLILKPFFHILISQFLAFACDFQLRNVPNDRYRRWGLPVVNYLPRCKPTNKFCSSFFVHLDMYLPV